MQPIHINFLALLVAAIARMVIGAIWYAPPVFGNTWMTLANVSPEQMKAGMGKSILTDFIGSYIMAFVLVHAIIYAGATTASRGVAVGFFNWLGFIGVVTFAMTMYEHRPFKLFWVNNGYQLISLLVMGAIIGAWA